MSDERSSGQTVVLLGRAERANGKQKFIREAGIYDHVHLMYLLERLGFTKRRRRAVVGEHVWSDLTEDMAGGQEAQDTSFQLRLLSKQGISTNESDDSPKRELSAGGLFIFLAISSTCIPCPVHELSNYGPRNTRTYLPAALLQDVRNAPLDHVPQRRHHIRARPVRVRQMSNRRPNRSDELVRCAHDDRRCLGNLLVLLEGVGLPWSIEGGKGGAVRSVDGFEGGDGGGYE